MSDKKDKALEALKDGVGNRVKSHTSRRGFIRSAILSSVAVAATAGLAKKTAESILPGQDHERAYLNDVLAGDKELSERQYVLMSAEEKEELLRAFTSSHSK